jgi:hypothetical protein
LDQIERLLDAVQPGPTSNSFKPDESASANEASECPGREASPLLDRAEIGQKAATRTQIETIDLAIRANPVENFDLARVVNVFAAYIQFYEFEVRGTQIQNRSVQLPKSPIASVRDEATCDRITTAFKLVSNDSRVSGAKIREKAVAIRRRFIHHHPTHGGVILKSNRAALDNEIVELEKLIEMHKNAVLSSFGDDAKKSIDELVEAFSPDIARTPPQHLADHLGTDKPTTEEAKDYLRHILSVAFPKADEVAKGMSVSRVVKDVTWNTLNEPGFVDWLKKQFPLRKDLQQPFELYHAAREKLKSKLQKT